MRVSVVKQQCQFQTCNNRSSSEPVKRVNSRQNQNQNVYFVAYTAQQCNSAGNTIFTISTTM